MHEIIPIPHRDLSRAGFENLPQIIGRAGEALRLDDLGDPRRGPLNGAEVLRRLLDLFFGHVFREADHAIRIRFPRIGILTQAVAEIVHQMAPAATLLLYCVEDRVGFAAAEQAIVANPAIKIVTSSLGFPGDGSSATDPTTFVSNSVTAAAVNDARTHGILWVESAGNNGR